MFPINMIQRRRRLMNRRLINTRRNIRDQNNPFDLPNRRFIELYRLDKALVTNLIRLLTPHMQQPLTRRGVPVEKKIFVALRFYATGSYQRCVGEEYNCGLSQSAVHFYCHEVTRVISNILVPQMISFPQTVEERNNNKAQFMNIFGFPGTLGAIDGTHIAILKPTVEEHNFINRKGFHSINCQIICDAKLKILNIFANFGGSSHDSFIWRQSEIKVYMERLHQEGERGWLIGDSGYPQSPVLMTPFRDPQDGTPEARYNQAHIRARNTVERCIGVLKGRFRCLLKERTARYKPEFVCELIKVCASLHNFCIEHNRNDIFEDVDIDPPENVDADPNRQGEGFRARNNIVNMYFR